MGTLDKGDVSTRKPQNQRSGTKKSVVWEHFYIKNNRAYCKQCNKNYAYSNGTKQSGTSHLRRHLDTGNCAGNRAQGNNLSSNLNGTISDPSKKRQRGANGALDSSFSQKRCNNEIARMILLHDYPLEMVEHPGFIDFVRTLQPQFETVSSDAIYNECISIYSSEKAILANLLSEIPGRVSLTLNMWSADETLGYAVLSGHYVDNDWRLHRRLLNVITVPYPGSEFAFNHAIRSCLSSWGLESKIFALTLDRSFASEDAIGNLRGLLSMENSHMLQGQFLIGSCYAHILTSLALNSINSMEETVQKVRNCVKYVKTSELNEERFMEIKLQLKNPSKKDLVLDNCTRWDSTYHMLSAASELKEVFACMDKCDHAPSVDEWGHIEALCDYLQCFYESATVLTAQKYPTADKFFALVCGIQWKLLNPTSMNDDPFVNNLVKPLIEKFDRYWNDCSLVLAMAVVLDPRHKLTIVERIFSQLYREQAKSYLKLVEDSVHALYLEYDEQSLPSLSFDVGEIHKGDVEAEEVSFDVGEIDKGDIETEEVSFDVEEIHKGDMKTEDPEQEFVFNDTFADIDIYISEDPSNHHTKSELHHYLEEYPHVASVQEDFQILDWWKLNQVRYPMLSKMAADFLSMPLSTVPRDSVFDTVSTKVDNYRGLMKPSAIEVFACAKDWLKSGMKL